MKKEIKIEVELYGDGTITEDTPGVFSGGVPDPNLKGIAFTIHREEDDLRPSIFEGALQINIYGTRNDYRELARYLLALAELDISRDLDFHDHQEVATDDGCTRLHFVLHRQIEETIYVKRK